MENDIKMYKPSLDKKIYDMLQSHRKMITLIQERNEIGTENGIKKEIEKLKKQKGDYFKGSFNIRRRT